MSTSLVVGLGSYQGDDRAGWLAINRLGELGYESSRLFHARHPAELLDVLDTEPAVIVCDACVGTDSPGMIHHFHWPTDKIVYQRPSGSHDLTLSDVLELGMQLHGTLRLAEIWAIEGHSWCAGSEPSREIHEAANQVAERIWKAFCDA